MRFLLVLLAITLGCSVADASRVKKCGTTDVVENPDIHLSACAKLPCKLKRSTDVQVEIKFKPENDTEKLTDSVHADILGIPFPFIGVDGSNICGKIFDNKGAKVSCPLKAGQEYVYKDKFPVLEVYPKIRVWVKWALQDSKGGNVICFQVPVKITA